jgi:hypothetical protein
MLQQLDPNSFCLGVVVGVLLTILVVLTTRGNYEQ